MIESPIWLAPMGGEAACAPLVAAVCEAGGLGWLGGAYLAPDRLGAVIDEIRTLTVRPFGVNLFWPQVWRRDSAREAALLSALAPFHERLGMAPPALPARFEEDFQAQLAVLRARRVAWVGFTFGDPGADLVAALHADGARVAGTATHVAEARRLAASGCDALIAQGAEAGAHRGSFLGSRDQGLVGTMALVPQVVDAVSLPVIAAGGIADARGVAAAQALGAAGVAAGTAFLLADECPLSPAYRAALLAGSADIPDSDADADADPVSLPGTVLTRAFSGRWARGLDNDFTRALAPLVDSGALPDFPIPNAVTRPMRQAAARAGVADGLALWAGQALPLARRAPARDIVRRLAAGWKT